MASHQSDFENGASAAYQAMIDRAEFKNRAVDQLAAELMAMPVGDVIDKLNAHYRRSYWNTKILWLCSTLEDAISKAAAYLID